eukprot:12620537-Prorocentrum_lima.AAC.1
MSGAGIAPFIGHLQRPPRGWCRSPTSSIGHRVSDFNMTCQQQDTMELLQFEKALLGQYYGEDNG